MRVVNFFGQAVWLRRFARVGLNFSLVGLGSLAVASLACSATEPPRDPNGNSVRSGIGDFDFIVGRWHVHHRQLLQRLVGSNDWIEFDGTVYSQKLLGGSAVVDDNLISLPGHLYHALNIRAYDAKTQLWSTWWLDGRASTVPLEPAVRGRFEEGVGLFYADDTFKQRPIRVRYVYSNITPKSVHWEQAFSADGGHSWEVNWIMDFERIDDADGID